MAETFGSFVLEMKKDPLKMKKRKTLIMYCFHNVSINTEKTAGQTIMHCHIHLIPRKENDVVDPLGGVRNVIPGKGNYNKAMK